MQVILPVDIIIMITDYITYWKGGSVLNCNYLSRSLGERNLRIFLLVYSNHFQDLTVDYYNSIDPTDKDISNSLGSVSINVLVRHITSIPMVMMVPYKWLRLLNAKEVMRHFIDFFMCLSGESWLNNVTSSIL